MFRYIFTMSVTLCMMFQNNSTKWRRFIQKRIISKFSLKHLNWSQSIRAVNSITDSINDSVRNSERMESCLSTNSVLQSLEARQLVIIYDAIQYRSVWHNMRQNYFESSALLLAPWQDHSVCVCVRVRVHGCVHVWGACIHADGPVRMSICAATNKFIG